MKAGFRRWLAALFGRSTATVADTVCTEPLVSVGVAEVLDRPPEQAASKMAIAM
jgi:hypothetical protein